MFVKINDERLYLWRAEREPTGEMRSSHLGTIHLHINWIDP
jgi:hypothetical protein